VLQHGQRPRADIPSPATVLRRQGRAVLHTAGHELATPRRRIVALSSTYRLASSVVAETSSGIPRSRFEQILLTVEQGLRLKLDEARFKTSHAGDIGQTVESATRTSLRTYLPRNFGVGHGKVYDAYGDESAQTDIIITNQDHPFSYPPEVNGAYLIDGVAAVGEVKSVLTHIKLNDCLEKATKFKRLRQTLGSMDSPVKPDVERMLEATGAVPPFFVVAFENEIPLRTLFERLKAAKPVAMPEGKVSGFGEGRGDSPQPPIDCVCLLNTGVLWNLRDVGPFQLLKEDGSPKTGWDGRRTEAPLAWTLCFLHSVMPRIHRGLSPLGPYMATTPTTRAYMEKNFGWKWAPSFTTMEEEWEGEDG
jgi:hypothetical protein